MSMFWFISLALPLRTPSEFQFFVNLFWLTLKRTCFKIYTSIWDVYVQDTSGLTLLARKASHVEFPEGLQLELGIDSIFWCVVCNDLLYQQLLLDWSYAHFSDAMYTSIWKVCSRLYSIGRQQSRRALHGPMEFYGVSVLHFRSLVY